MNPMEFAINLEKNGEKYYREQAEKYKGTSVFNIFVMLANDENYHAQILEKKLANKEFELKDTAVVDESKDIFSKAEEFSSDIFSEPRQVDLLREALDKEEESIDLYQKLYDEAGNEEDSRLFMFLINEEKKHYKTIDELIKMHRHAEEWVEDAEFGNRDPY